MKSSVAEQVITYLIIYSDASHGSAPFSSPACLLLLTGESSRMYDPESKFLQIVLCHVLKIVVCVLGGVLKMYPFS